MNRTKLIRMMAYGAFANFSLLLGLYLTFPSAAVGQRLAYEINRRSEGKVTASFEEVDLYFLTGIEAQNVRLKLNVTDPPIPIAIDALTARVQLLPLLWLQPTIATTVEMGKTTIDAELRPQSRALGVTADIDGLDLGKAGFLSALAGLPVNGVVSGKAELEWADDPRATQGDVTLTLADLQLGPGNISMLPLSAPLRLGQVDLALSAEGGQLVVKQFKQSGANDVAIKSLTGDTTLGGALRSNRFNACVQLKPQDEFQTRNKAAKSAVEMAGAFLKKDGEGFLHANLSGSFSGMPQVKPQLCTERGAAAATARPARPPRGGAKP